MLDLDRIPDWLVYLGSGYIIAWQTGYVDPPDIPGYSPIAGLLALAVIATAWVLAGKIAELLPDPYSNIVVEMDAGDDGGRIWELNDEAIESLEIKKADRLFRWDSPKITVYECRNLNPEQLVAVGNWKGTKTGTELSRPIERDEVMKQVRMLRNDHEQDARYGQAIRDAIPSLLRQLDKRRAKSLNAALEGYVSPNLGGQSIDDMIEDQLPDEVIPDYLQREGEGSRADQAEPDSLGFEILDEGEALDPVESPPGPEVRHDGGKNEL